MNKVKRFITNFKQRYETPWNTPIIIIIIIINEYLFRIILSVLKMYNIHINIYNKTVFRCSPDKILKTN